MADRGRENKVIIIGLGNLLRQDEGFGIWAAQRLVNDKLPPGIEIIDGGTGGPNLLPYFERAAKLILVDAIEAGSAPGTIFRLNLSPKDDGCYSPLSRQPFSLHQWRLLEVVELAQLLGLRAEALLLGVQPKLLGWGVGLSPELEVCVPEVAGLALAECVSREVSR